MDLHASRHYTDMGTPLGISYAEITERGAALRRPLAPYQVQAVRAIDRAFLSCVAEQATRDAVKSDG